MMQPRRRRINASFARYVIVVTGVVFTTNVWAQGSIKRPGDDRLEAPLFEVPKKKEEYILPTVPLPRRPDTEGLAAERRVFIRVYYFTGNTVLTDSELVQIAMPYSKRRVTFTELAELQDQITLAYIERGYLNSGAVIPHQAVDDGVLHIQIIEGSLTDIDIETDGRFRERFISDRVRRGIERPLNINVLEERLKILQQDDRIQNIQAALVPGKTRGESRLKLQVKENKPFTVRFQADNYEPPAVGAKGGRIFLVHNNLTGYGDRLSGNYSRTKGLWSAEVYYSVPVNTYDTTLEFDVYRSDSEVDERPFEELDIENEFESYEVTVRQPVRRTLQTAFNLSLSAEYRRSTSFLLGVQEIVSEVNVIRFGQDLTLRGRQQVLALRSLFSFGLDMLGATSRSGDLPDSRFFTWLGQIQWVRRIRLLNARLIARAELQLSDDPLLSMEQFAIGGHASVRGYRENTLIRENGGIASLEVRIPVWYESRGASRVDLGIFYDAGHGWDEGNPSDSKTLTSAGVGLHGQLGKHLSFRLEWAESLNNKSFTRDSLNSIPRESKDRDLQDDGIHFQLATEF